MLNLTVRYPFHDLLHAFDGIRKVEVSNKGEAKRVQDPVAVVRRLHVCLGLIVAEAGSLSRIGQEAQEQHQSNSEKPHLGCHFILPLLKKGERLLFAGDATFMQLLTELVSFWGHNR